MSNDDAVHLRCGQSLAESTYAFRGGRTALPAAAPRELAEDVWATSVEQRSRRREQRGD